LEWIEEIRGEKAIVYRSERKSLKYQCKLFSPTTKKGQAIGDYLDHAVSAAAAEKMTLFHTDSKALAEQLAATLLEEGVKPLLITSRTSSDRVVVDFLTSKGAALPSMIKAGYGAIVTSPSVKEGLSVKLHTELIDSVWGVFQGVSIPVEAVCQTLDRVRSENIPRYLWVAEKGRNYSKISKGVTSAEVTRDLRDGSRLVHALVRRELTTDKDILAGGIDFENSRTVKLFASIEANKNLGMSAFRAGVVSILIGRGKEIIEHDASSTLDEARSLRVRLGVIRDRLAMERAIAIESAIELTEEQVTALEGIENLTPENKLSLEKFYLTQFYRLEQVTVEDVLWDGESKRRHAIRNFEQILNPALAMAKSAGTITQNTTTPQDWNRSVLQAKIMEDSGIASLIRDIWEERVDLLDQDRVEAIATKLRANPELFRLGFNFSNMSKVTDRQLVFYLLDWVGITRISTRARVNGHQIRRYSVDQANLEKLKTIVDRRSQAAPPPLTNELPGGGAALAEWQDLPLDEALELTETWLSATTIEEKRAVLAVVDEVREAIAA